jgi:NitT/TauT family transport system substrate-binding protein
MNHVFRGGRTAALAAGSAAVLLAITGCFAGDEPSAPTDDAGGDLTPVRLALNNTSSSLSAVVAEQEGFFEDHGLAVTSEVLADITKIPAALGNQFDIGFGVAPLVIRGSSQGLDIVVVSGNGTSSAEHPHMVIVATEDSGIESAEDLVGKTLAAPTLTGTLHLGTLQWLLDAGVTSDDVNSVQVVTPSMIDQLNQGVIDAAELQEPFLSLAREQGMVEVGYSLSAVADVAQESVWISSGGWADENEETVLAFRAAISDAAQWIVDNQAEAQEILAEFTQSDLELVQNAAILLFDSEVRVADLEAWGEVMQNVTDFDAEVDYGSLIAYPGGE